jgi:hypothetical protein
MSEPIRKMVVTSPCECPFCHGACLRVVPSSHAGEWDLDCPECGVYGVLEYHRDDEEEQADE